MSLTGTLVTILGKPLAENLVRRLTEPKGGRQKFEEATKAVGRGMTAIEALRQTYGSSFLNGLNAALADVKKISFKYEANTQSYIRLDYEDISSIRVLRDELNINLDRLSSIKPLTEHDVEQVEREFSGLIKIWQDRLKQFLYADEERTTSKEVKDDIDSTFKAIQALMDDELTDYRQIAVVLSRTSLGGLGALMILIGTSIATGLGGGIFATFSMFLFGIPWLSVSAMVLPGILLIVLATRKTRTADKISISIALAYRLLERIEAKS